jgi:hypothetical protein
MDQGRREELFQRYAAACHAMQAGVAMMMNHDQHATQPKHLRVGVNSAMVEHGALANLLMAKGIVTEEEYFVALCEGMEAEVAKYEAECSRVLGGAVVKLV